MTKINITPVMASNIYYSYVNKETVKGDASVLYLEDGKVLWLHPDGTSVFEDEGSFIGWLHEENSQQPDEKPIIEEDLELTKAWEKDIRTFNERIDATAQLLVDEYGEPYNRKETDVENECFDEDISGIINVNDYELKDLFYQYYMQELESRTEALCAKQN